MRGYLNCGGHTWYYSCLGFLVYTVYEKNYAFLFQLKAVFEIIERNYLIFLPQHCCGPVDSFPGSAAPVDVLREQLFGRAGNKAN